ncbi:MAG: DUF1330 domain-containing protein [Thermoplasmata archaeon]
MPAYLVLQIGWHDQAKSDEYRAKLGPTLDKFGGKTLYAGEPRLLEGKWEPVRTVLIEFPTMDALQSWYGSEEYAPLLRLRLGAAQTNMVAADRPAH